MFQLRGCKTQPQVAPPSHRNLVVGNKERFAVAPGAGCAPWRKLKGVPGVVPPSRDIHSRTHADGDARVS